LARRIVESLVSLRGRGRSHVFLFVAGRWCDFGYTGKQWQEERKLHQSYLLR